MRIDLKRGLQRIPRLLLPAGGLGDYSGVIEKQRIPSSKLQSLLARLCSIRILAVLVESPGKGIPGIDVVSYFKFLPRQGRAPPPV